MKLSSGWAVGVVVATLCFSTHGSEENIKEGKITLKDARKNSQNRQVIRVGEKVVFKVNAYIDDFIGDMIINANANLINLTNDSQELIYAITFYDADKNIVGAYAANCLLDPNESTYFGSALIDGKVEDFKRVVSYRLYTCSYKALPTDNL
jgi:hypothetical protein